MQKRKIVCGRCQKEVWVVNFNRVRSHKEGPGGRECTLSGAHAEAAVKGLRVLPKK